ncbi:MAG: hypothetical protein JSS27_04095 [Planctomycetes bacterium]|nr:hypothetical protein [Planctomycetota bacterium]
MNAGESKAEETAAKRRRRRRALSLVALGFLFVGIVAAIYGYVWVWPRYQQVLSRRALGSTMNADRLPKPSIVLECLVRREHLSFYRPEIDDECSFVQDIWHAVRDDDPIVITAARCSNLTADEIGRLAHLDRLASVSLRGGEITDKAVKSLAKLKNLKTLELRGGSNLEMSSLTNFANNRILKSLSVIDIHLIGDVGDLGKHSQLKYLMLHRTGLDDDGLKHLSSIGSLRSLELDEPKVSRNGLFALVSMTNLEHLSIPAELGDSEWCGRFVDCFANLRLSCGPGVMFQSGGVRSNPGIKDKE